MGKRLKLDLTQPERSVNPADPGGSLLTAPAERWDVVVNFNGKSGKKYVLYNDAPAPFPGGGPENDGPSVPATTPGEVIYTNQILMRFVVKPDSPTITPDKPLFIQEWLPLAPDPLSGIDRPLTVSWFKQTPIAGVKKVRHLTLNEIFDEKGRLIQMLGTNQLVPMPMGFSADDGTAGAPEKTYARGYMDTATEDPEVGTVEIWQIANLTGDTHPMHFHLVNAQLLSRQPFSDYKDGKPVFGPNDKSRGPDPLELGWKDTIKMNPGEVTSIIMKFDLAPVPFNVPESPRKDMEGKTVGGNEFVWHCHILEHEEHDMMRPLVVRGKNPRLS
jgi:spore coat protein A